MKLRTIGSCLAWWTLLGLPGCGGSTNNNSNPGADGGVGTDVPRGADGSVAPGTDGGNPSGTWSMVSAGVTTNLFGIWGTSASAIYAVGPQTVQYYNGSTWASGGSTVYTLQGVGGGTTTGFAVGVTVPPNGSGETGMGVLLQLTGTMPPNMVTDPTPLSQPVLAWGRADNDIWTVGADTVLHWNGSSWSDLSSMGIMQGTMSNPASNLYAVWGASANDIHVAGQLVYHWNGTAFTPEPQNVGDFYYGVWGSSSTDVWLVGSGVARHYNGTTWSDVRVNTLMPIRAIWGTAANNIWAVGDQGTIIHYNGTTWSSVTSPTTQVLRAIWGTGAGNIWVVGDQGTTLHYVQ